MSPSLHAAAAGLAVVAKPQGCTNLKLRQLMRRVAQRYDAEVGQVGLKGTQYSVLSHITKLGPIRPVDLAGLMRVDASTLSRNLKPLVAAGWITLEAGADARSRLIHATDAGREKRHEAQRRWRVAQEGINSAIGADRVMALHALIDEAMACLDDPGEGDEPGE